MAENNFARAAHYFCTFLSRCFAQPECETSRNFLVTSFMEEMLYVFLFTLFSLPLIFTLVAGSTSHFLTTAIKLSCYSTNEISLLCFLSLALALSLLSTSMWTLKLSRKKELSLLLLLFFISKSPSGYAIYRRNARVPEMQNFTLAYMKGCTYVRTRTDIFSEPNFLGCIDNQIFLHMLLLYYFVFVFFFFANQGSPVYFLIIWAWSK